MAAKDPGSLSDDSISSASLTARVLRTRSLPTTWPRRFERFRLPGKGYAVDELVEMIEDVA
jgi:hypothetical protein